MDFGELELGGWILFFAFALFCGFGAFYLVYGAVRVLEGDESSDAVSTWLLNHRAVLVIALAIICAIVIVVVGANASRA